ncbi:MAG: Outer membrane protein TolC [Paracidovorax wautersii]|uniref:Outer membrane protein TolC n=1 Tax=Paracidovorax wautersii TaxID=1177982 RepID=A0A7V8JQ21_9BURK|nr:MAG: Outer membrane protein TolC [Paracidovorax wautersii]
MPCPPSRTDLLNLARARPWRGWLVAGAALAWAHAAQAQSLLEFYQAARSHDSAYQAALAQYQAELAAADQTRAGLLPQVDLGAGASRARNELYGPRTSVNGGNENIGVTARQPLFRPANVANREQGLRRADSAQAQLEQVDQNLIVRVNQAYFDVLASQDSLDFVRAQKAAVAEQLEAAKRNFEVGTTTITDSREAQAQYDRVLAQEIAAENQLRVRQLVLGQLTGHPTARPQPTARPVELPALPWHDPAPLVQDAQRDHPRIRQAQLTRETSELETRKAEAARLPTIDATAGYQVTHARNGGTLNTPDRRNDASIGLVLNLPLYAGGAIQNRIRETLALEDKAAIELDGVRRQVEQDVRTAYLNQLSNASSVRALEAAEASSQSALEANQLGYEVGVRINIDVLNAQSQLYQTKRDLAQARYNVLLGDLQLRQAAGRLTVADLERLNTGLLAASQPLPAGDTTATPPPAATGK